VYCVFRCIGDSPEAIGTCRAITNSSDCLSPSSGSSVCHGHWAVCVWSDTSFSAWLADKAEHWEKKVFFFYFFLSVKTLHNKVYRKNKEKKKKLLQIRMIDFQNFLWDRPHTVCLFQGSDKTHVDQYTDH